MLAALLHRLHGKLQHPLTRDLDVDSPTTTYLRKQIVTEKEFLNRVYHEWYGVISKMLPREARDVLEIGSGAGFFATVLPHAITSEVFEVPGISLIENAESLSFSEGSLDAIVMTEVFHHIQNVDSFLREATRVLRPGARVVMVEPWKTGWSQIIYRRLHHEPFEPTVLDWRLPEGGPLSVANGALPWIVFERDRQAFQEAFPALRIRSIQAFMPVSYLCSGGLSIRFGFPAWSYGLVRGMERKILKERGAMFAVICLERL